MAEAFSNSIKGAVGIITTNSSAGSIGAAATVITGISTVGVAVSDMVVNQHFRGGTKVYSIGAGLVTCTKASTNTTAATSQDVDFLGPTTAYTSSTKSILIGGTFANLAPDQVKIYVELHDSSGEANTNICNDIPVPTGSSFVISDAGKTVMEANDQIVVYSNTATAVDVTLSVLTGVS